ncbi:polyprenyl synthetase [Streptomyces sviceus ATCC 29083]|uniref:Polyprenyl synthetase n=2 Tax=Streptomyces TaxID=1883 RepID=B5HS46_STRX2|nr:polyprenyl synthetase [Streptomyces sviceus ATCC 29083]
MIIIIRHEALHDPGAEPGYFCAFTCDGDPGVFSGSWVSPAGLGVLRDAHSGDLVEDTQLRAALLEVLAEGVPLPDRLIEEPVRSSDTVLDIALGELGALFRSESGGYRLSFHGGGLPQLDLELIPKKPSVAQFHEHGQMSGRFPDGGDTQTTRILPRLDAQGTVTYATGEQVAMQGQAWFENTWGGAMGRTERRKSAGDLSWEWAGVQLDNGWEISALQKYVADVVTGSQRDQVIVATAVAPEGSVAHHEMIWQPLRHWTSAATLNTFPTAVRFRIPALDMDLEVTGPADGHEIRTLIAGSGWWESPAIVTGTMGGTPVRGQAFLQTLPVGTIDNISSVTRRAFAIARDEAAAVYPSSPRSALAAVTGTEQGPPLDTSTQDRLHESLVQPVRMLLDAPGRAWRPYTALSVLCLFGADPEPYRPLAALTELLHTASLIIDDIQDGSPLRRGRATVHEVIGTPAAITAGTAAFFAFEPLLQRIPQHDPATMLRVYQLCLRALRAGHAGQALDLSSHQAAFDHAVTTGDNRQLLADIRTTHRLKSGVPVRCIAEVAAVLADADEAQIRAVGDYFETVGIVYQISDDVADLDGVSTAQDRRQGRTAKRPAEDLLNGKVTYPVAHAVARLDQADRFRLRDALRLRTPAGAAQAAELLTHSGSPQICLEDTHDMMTRAWAALAPVLPPTQHKALICALGWYAAQRIPDQAGPDAEEDAR